MVYDDGEDGVLARLAEQFGPSIMGVVLAHEYGHAIQARSGALPATCRHDHTEQQADCFAGAWTAQASPASRRASRSATPTSAPA